MLDLSAQRTIDLTSLVFITQIMGIKSQDYSFIKDYLVELTVTVTEVTVNGEYFLKMDFVSVFSVFKL